MKKLFVFIIIALILVEPANAVPTAFIDINLDKNLDKVYVRTIISGPQSDIENCTTKEDKLTTCSTFLYFNPPVWARVENTTSYINTQKFYVLTHPDTKAQFIQNCSSLSAGLILNSSIDVYQKNGVITGIKPNIPDAVTLSFSLYNNYSSSCIYLEYPYLNPNLVKKYEWLYPFDYYVLEPEFYIPNISLVNIEIDLPEDFKFSNIETFPKTETLIGNSNIIFFAFKDLDKPRNEPFFGANIEFNRFPNLVDKLFPVFILLILPLTLFLYFNYSIDGSKDNASTTTFYMSLIPLFFIVYPYFAKIPSTYSLFHASLVFSMLLLMICIRRDYTNWSVDKNKRNSLIVLSALLAMVPLLPIIWRRINIYKLDKLTNVMEPWAYVIISFLFLLSIVALLWWAALKYYSKILKVVEKNRSEARECGNNIGIGISSGVIVLVVDKVVTVFFSDVPKLSLNSGLDFFFSLLSALMIILLASGVIAFTVSLIVYYTVRPIEKK